MIFLQWLAERLSFFAGTFAGFFAKFIRHFCYFLPISVDKLRIGQNEYT